MTSFNVDSGSDQHLINNKEILNSQSPTHLSVSTATNTIFIAGTKGPLITSEIELRNQSTRLLVSHLPPPGYNEPHLLMVNVLT